MTTRRRLERDSIRSEAEGLRGAALALEPLWHKERRRVLVLLCDRFMIDPTTLGTVNRDGSAQG